LRFPPPKASMHLSSPPSMRKGPAYLTSLYLTTIQQFGAPIMKFSLRNFLHFAVIPPPQAQISPFVPYWRTLWPCSSVNVRSQVSRSCTRITKKYISVSMILQKKRKDKRLATCC
jgi:hypothetical protein